MFRVEEHGERVRLLRMDDGKVNAMGPAFVRAFGDAWRAAASDGRAVVLAGNAKAFCAGLDLKTLPSLEGAALEDFVRGFVGAFRDVWTYPGPVVAAVDGPALAGGAFLALCSDLRLVGPSARLGLTEVQVGVPFPPRLVDLAAAALPPQEHGPALLQAAVRQGEACVAHGWAHRYVPNPAILVPEALALAQDLAGLDAHAYARTKDALRSDVARRLDGFLKEGVASYCADLGSAETKARIVKNFQRIAGAKK